MKIKDNFKFQVFICIVIGCMMIGSNFYMKKSFKEFRLEFDNFQLEWNFLFDEEEYEIKTIPKNTDKLNNI